MKKTFKFKFAVTGFIKAESEEEAEELLQDQSILYFGDALPGTDYGLDDGISDLSLTEIEEDL